MNRFAIDEEFLNKIELLRLALKDNVAGLFGGNHKSKAYGSSCEFADYREYVPGDDIGKIDWNVFARFERLYLKLFFDERQMHTKIYIDASSSMGYDNKGLKALQIAAAIAYLSIRAADKASIYYIQNKQVFEIVPPLVSIDVFYNRIVKLNEIDFTGDSFISDSIIDSQAGYGDGKSVIISDFLTDNDYFSAVRHLREKRRDVLLIQILSENELNPFQRGKHIFYDSEKRNSSYKKNIDRDVIKAYREALDFMVSEMENRCRSFGSDYILLNSDSALEELFMKRLPEQGVLK